MTVTERQALSGELLRILDECRPDLWVRYAEGLVKEAKKLGLFEGVRFTVLRSIIDEKPSFFCKAVNWLAKRSKEIGVEFQPGNSHRVERCIGPVQNDDWIMTNVKAFATLVELLVRGESAEVALYEPSSDVKLFLSIVNDEARPPKWVTCDRVCTIADKQYKHVLSVDTMKKALPAAVDAGLIISSRRGYQSVSANSIGAD